jgi:hypothetical protein
VELTGGDRHARLLVADVFERQITPAAGHLADFQPRNPAVRRLNTRCKPVVVPTRNPTVPSSSTNTIQYAEAYLLP